MKRIAIYLCVSTTSGILAYSARNLGVIVRWLVQQCLR